jgi:hypothetical protein
VRDAMNAHALVVALVIVAVGCRTMAPVATPQSFISDKHPESIWVTRADHSVVRIHGPHMLGDTVVGDVKNQYTKIALADVMGVAVSHVATGRTVALAAAGGALVVGGLVVLFSHYGGNTAQNTCLTPNDFEDYCGGPAH